MKISAPQTDARVTSNSVPDKTSLLQHVIQRLKAIFLTTSSLATASLIEPQNEIAESLTRCTPLRPDEEHNSPPTPEQAANTITQAIRQQIAEKAYRSFFSLNSKYAGHYEPGQSATAHLKAQSRKHLAAVTQRLGVLTPKEQAFFDKVATSPWAFQHTSNHDLEQNSHLRLYSSSRLDEEGKLTACCTPKSDQDLVFLSIDFSAERIRGPVSEEKVIQYNYGNNAYVIHEGQPLLEQGFLTLTNSILTKVGESRSWDNYPERYQRLASEAKNEMQRTIGFGDENPCYAFSDMKTAVALHTIEFLRQSKDAGFVKFVLEEADLSGADLDHILNTILDCEFHLPRSVVTSHYSTFQLQKPETRREDERVTAALNQHNLPLLKSVDKQLRNEHITNYFRYPRAKVNTDTRENAGFLATLISQGLVDANDPPLLNALIEKENLLLLEVMFNHGADETSLNPRARAHLAKLRCAGASLKTIIMTADSQALDRYIENDDDVANALAIIIENNATAMIEPLATQCQLDPQYLVDLNSNRDFYFASQRLTQPEHAQTLDKLLSSGLVDPDKLPGRSQHAPTPLQQAIKYRNDKTAEVLIRHGADISRLTHDEHKKYAFLRKYGAFLESLIKRSDLTALRKCLTDKETAMQVLGQALARNNSEVVGMVLATCTANDWHISAQDYAPADAAALDMKACVAFLNSGYAKPAWFGRLIPPELLEEALRTGLRPLTTRFH